MHPIPTEATFYQPIYPFGEDYSRPNDHIPVYTSNSGVQYMIGIGWPDTHDWGTDWYGTLGNTIKEKRRC